MEVNKIYNMDCLVGMKDIPDHSVDCIICDLPYGTTRNEWDSIIPLDKLWAQYKRVIKKGGAIVLFSQTPFDKVLACSNLEWLRYELIWVKDNATGFLNAQKMPMKLHENILVFYDSLPTYNPQMTEGKAYVSKGAGFSTSSNYGKMNGTNKTKINNGRFPTSILKFARDPNRIHPTQKPVNLLRWLIRTYSNEGELILDNCMGSGTTAIASVLEKRNFIGFELDSNHFKNACARVLAAQKSMQ